MPRLPSSYLVYYNHHNLCLEPAEWFLHQQILDYRFIFSVHFPFLVVVKRFKNKSIGSCISKINKTPIFFLKRRWNMTPFYPKKWQGVPLTWVWRENIQCPIFWLGSRNIDIGHVTNWSMVERPLKHKKLSMTTYIKDSRKKKLLPKQVRCINNNLRCTMA